MANGCRRHYMTLCMYNDTVVTTQIQGDILVVTFEQAIKGGFKTLNFDIAGNIISNFGFDNSETAIFHDFVIRNAAELIKSARGEYDA